MLHFAWHKSKIELGDSLATTGLCVGDRSVRLLHVMTLYSTLVNTNATRFSIKILGNFSPNKE